MTAKLSLFAALFALAACSGSGASDTAGESGTTGPNGPSGGSTSAGASSSAAASSTGTANGTTGAAASSSAAASSTGTGTGTTGGTITGNGTTGGTSTGNGTMGGTTGTPCTYNSNTNVDSCTAQGYECTGELTGTASGICVLPEDLGVCDGDPNGDVGCQDGGVPNGQDGGTGDLFCSMGFQNSSGMVDLCLYSCVDTSDCPDLFQSCITQLGGCFNNFCGEDDTGEFVGPYFGTCPVESTADGQCLAFNASPNTLGVCSPNGTAAAGQPCNPQFRYGEFDSCTYGNFCVLSTASGDGGLCFPITIDGGTCADGDDPVFVETGADWAVCAPDCTTSMNCDGGPAGTTCQATTNGAVSICLP